MPAATDAATVQAMVRVLAVDETHLELEAVEAGAAGACARCDQGQGCGQSLLLRLRRQSSARLRLGLDQLINPEDWPGRPGVGVLCRLEIASSSLLKMTILLYGLPLLGLMSGTGLAVAAMGGFDLNVSALQQDLVAAAAGLLGMGVGARLVKNLSPLSYCDVRLRPQI